MSPSACKLPEGTVSPYFIIISGVPRESDAKCSVIVTNEYFGALSRGALR